MSFAVLLTCSTPAWRRLPAFSGAEGVGSITSGGPGGEVFVVTNLANSGPDSLHEACLASGPRIAVFAVTDETLPGSAIIVTNPYP